MVITYIGNEHFGMSCLCSGVEPRQNTVADKGSGVEVFCSVYGEAVLRQLIFRVYFKDVLHRYTLRRKFSSRIFKYAQLIKDVLHIIDRAGVPESHVIGSL